MRTLSETLREVAGAGASINLTTDRRLDIDFGDAEVPESLLVDLRHHADTLREYLPTLQPRAPGWSPDLEVTVGTTAGRFVTWTPFDEPMGPTVAVDTETVYREKGEADHTAPEMILATAWDGRRGYFIRPANVAEFLRAQPAGTTFVFHSAHFDVAVIDAAEGADAQAGVVWQLLDANRIVCTQQLERLIRLATDGKAPEFVSLADAARHYLGVEIEKEAPDFDGEPIRHRFGKFVGRELGEIPPAFLEYAAGDVVATLNVWCRQQAEVGRIRRAVAPRAFGFTTDAALGEAWSKYGLLSLNVQVKAAVICRELLKRGVTIDRERVRQAITNATEIRERSAERLRRRGLFVPRPGETRPKDAKALSTAVKERVISRESELLDAGEITQPFKRTATGNVCIDAEQQQTIADATGDDLLKEFAIHEQAGRFITFLKSLDHDTIRPTFKSLRNTGRFSCEKPNAQQMPKCGRAKVEIEPTVRQAFTPGSGHVFAIVDFHQLEGRSLAAFWKHQVGFGDTFAGKIEAGIDAHTALATELHGREPTKTERSQVKPQTFGVPAGMGVAAIIRTAKAQGVELTEQQVEDTIAAYHRMAPELEKHLARTRDAGEACRRMLGLKSKWEAWQLLKMIAGDNTADDEEQAANLWDKAQQFIDILPNATKVDQTLVQHLRDRKPSVALSTAIRRQLDDEPVMVMSGRLRGKTKFTESRNGVFQGSAADGMILATWALIRAGFDVRLVVHDEVVVRLPDDQHRDERLAEIERIMCSTMQQALSGIPARVESYISSSWSERDKVTTPPKKSTTVSRSALRGKIPGASGGGRSMLKGQVPGTTATKPRRPKVDQVGRQARKSWAEKLESGEFDADELPF